MEDKYDKKISSIIYEYQPDLLIENIEKDSTILIEKDTKPIVPNLYINKISGKKYSKPGDIIDYTVILANKGNINFNKLVVLDNMPKELTYINQSIEVIVNTDALEYRLDYYLEIDDIENRLKIVINKIIYTGDIVIVNFNAEIDNNTSTEVLKNEIRLGYSYIDEDKSLEINPLDKEIADAYTLTYMEYASLTVTKCIDKYPSNIGDTMSYKLELINNGNLKAINVKIEEYVLEDMYYSKAEGEIQEPGKEKAKFEPQAILNDNNLLIITKIEVPQGRYIESSLGEFDFIPGKSVITIYGEYRGE
ncbi:hypothetical protein CHL78_007135 [Romboutsia weinsteinii]|uniref:DUF11 domain-containing protein n=1 Tax=Romboutsia weinsteinii TaxID=2020949 RepID=A0A371J5P5_9FIRM|nr:DUF11 domain-containing protein [Romboutsia weinsteinii]RDY28069.1 hypothetical protein CHL78_007135 [Romboutsia weinsteinii]